MSVSAHLPNHYSGLIVEFNEELFSIAEWWVNNAFDFEKRDFVGEIDDCNIVNLKADKGSIYNSRLLWFFSKLAKHSDKPSYRQAADIAYRSLCDKFWAPITGGVFWKIDYQGNVADSRKHVYAQSFAIYALCAYHAFTGLPEVLSKAMSLYERLESVAFKPGYGYYESFTDHWQELEDTRLNENEPIHPRNVNTQLHLMEAYTALYSRNPDLGIFNALKRLVEYFQKYFIDRESYHLKMFLDADWRDRASYYSYGHDIECSWLLWEAVEALKEPDLLATVKPIVEGMAATCLREGLGENGEVLDGYDRINKQRIERSPWWVQAEAMIGFLNAYQLTGEAGFYQAFAGVWQFIKNWQIDRVNGEWHWFPSMGGETGKPENYKAGFWKGPYHNGRAMMEICDRLTLMGSRTR